MNHQVLTSLGWKPFFQQQIAHDEWDVVRPVRVVEQHRSEIKVSTGSGEKSLPMQPSMAGLVVGDWLLLDESAGFIRILDRISCFSRKAAGSEIKKQHIAANIDTAFIVTSMNDDFNLSRLERFLALVNESGAQPIVVLSKSDLANEPEQFVQAVQGIDRNLIIQPVNCLDASQMLNLSAWLAVGQTVSVLGSSGVGKSTLVNTLLGVEEQSTAGIREDDAKGRHTTTRRSLLALPAGGLILDTPGMREIQLADSLSGIETTFSDIENLADTCRFSDCQHVAEPGCSVQKALAEGRLDIRRFKNYQKLLREDALNSASLSERRASDKALGKYYKKVLGESTKLKGR